MDVCSPRARVGPAPAMVARAVVARADDADDDAMMAQQKKPKKPKQTRNKPTLSCYACVNHKTKVSNKPMDLAPKSLTDSSVCLACTKRGSDCRYSHIADILNGADPSMRRRSRAKTKAIKDDFEDETRIERQSSRGSTSGVFSTDHATSDSSYASPLTQLAQDTAFTPLPATADDSPLADTTALHALDQHSGPNGIPNGLPNGMSNGVSTGANGLNGMHGLNSLNGTTNGKDHPQHDRTRRVLAGFGNAGLLMSSENTPMGIFGASGEHPFANYWTCKGGLAEVISVLPSKSQADILVAKYFEIVDPLYPILDRSSFLREYDYFWSLSYEEKCKYEAAAVSLHFVIYATATQYIELPSASERTKTAEFYISAGHQAIRISSYLNRISITTVQTMILFFNFLINDNHISDAWTFSGITQRQAYVLQLNREPHLVVPHASPTEMNLRCMLWAFLVMQESSIALTLRLPSTSLQCDVGPHSLQHEGASAASAAPTPAMLDVAPAKTAAEVATDLSYCRSIWAYAVFVQENVCRQRALGLPMCRSNEHKREVLSSFRSLYRSFQHPFGSYDPMRFLDPSLRVARQQIALTQSFFHAMMLICADENAPADVIIDTYGAFEAAHEAMAAFFAMTALFGDETNGWWTYQHKAFEEAMLVAKLLAADTKPIFPPAAGSGRSREYNMLVQAKDDVKRLLGIMSAARGFHEVPAVEERRFDTLQALYDTINVV